jgi:diguanylate cyclase (GGDEF)-like protein
MPTMNAVLPWPDTAPKRGASEPPALTSGIGAVLDALPQPAWLVHLDSRRVVAANAAAALLFGCSREQLLGRAGDSLASSPEDQLWWAAAALGQVEPLHSDTIVATADGRVLHASRSIRALTLDGMAPQHCLVSLVDRSAEQRVEAEREELLSELQATLESTGDGMLVTDLGGHIRAFNRRFAELWSLPGGLEQGRDDAAVLAWMGSQTETPDVHDRRFDALQQAPQVSATDRLLLRCGRTLERVSRPLMHAGRPQGRVYAFRDLTERIEADRRIAALSLTDVLTGLPNRRALGERLVAACERARVENRSFAVLLIDLDRFRQINESIDHEAGDRVLIDVAQRIQGCLRQDDMLARVGGDQFVALVVQADDHAAEAAAKRILNVVAQPRRLDTAEDGLQYTLSCSIGVALCPSHGWTGDELLRRAESAMRAVKLAGRADFRLHQARGESDRRDYMRLDNAMRQALASSRFRLHYQPQIDLASGRLVGAEALLRWRDPQLGEVSPARFIPVAEDTGFIVALGEWVLSQAVAQAALWHGRGIELPIAVNVSALQFQQVQFVDRVASVLAVSGLPAHLLELELTESILVRDADEALLRLQALADLGVRMSIDDFGTGYSSLSYLKRFPIGTLKIDRSFIGGLPGDGRDAGIVRAILQMARALGKRVVAEGVETEAQRDFLRAEGCDLGQGWLYAPALDSLSFEQKMLAPEPPAAPQPPPRHIRLVKR